MIHGFMQIEDGIRHDDEYTFVDASPTLPSDRCATCDRLITLREALKDANVTCPSPSTKATTSHSFPPVP